MRAVLRAGPLLLAALVSLVVLDGQFVYDDPSLLIENPVVNGEVPAWGAFVRDFWGRDAGQGFITWRPLMPIVWAQLWSVWPGEPLPFRLLGILLHVFSVAMCVRFVHRLTQSPELAAVTGALFALHPLNTEAVSAIAAQPDLLSFALVLIGCVLALGPQTLRGGSVCALMFLIAALVKESAIIFGPLAALLIILRPGSVEAKSLAVAPVALATAGVVAFQLSLPRAAGVVMITSNVAHSAEGSMHFLLGLHNLGRALTMTVWPHPIAPNHGYAAVELQVGSLAGWAALGAVLLVAGLTAGIWSMRRRRLDWVVALCFLYAPALLQTHWLTRLVTDLAERLLYPSVLGISMLFTIALFRIAHRPTIRWGLLCAAALVFLAVSLPSRRAWTDEDALWTYAVRVEPRAALNHHNVSNTYFRLGDVDRGAYHRLLYTYLIDRFPEAVQWEVIDAIELLPAGQRFVELPGALNPDDPCLLIRSFTAKARQYQPLYDYIVLRWPLRYPRCAPRGVE